VLENVPNIQKQDGTVTTNAFNRWGIVQSADLQLASFLVGVAIQPW
jgi:hypothetical protein